MFKDQYPLSVPNQSIKLTKECPSLPGGSLLTQEDELVSKLHFLFWVSNCNPLKFPWAHISYKTNNIRLLSMPFSSVAHQDKSSMLPQHL